MAENTYVIYEDLKLEEEVITYNNIKEEPLENIKLEDENSLMNDNCIKEEYSDNTQYLENELPSTILFNCKESAYVLKDVKNECLDEEVKDDKCGIDYMFNDEGFQSNRQNYKKETLYCDDCTESFEDFCPNCQTLTRLLDNCATIERNENEDGIKQTIPKNILEIRKDEDGEGIFALRSIPKGVIFGPFMGLETVEKSATEYAWKITKGQSFEKENIMDYKNWLSYIKRTEDDNLKNNLYAFQFKANLYYRSSRQISCDEELLVYYNNELFENVNNEMNECYCPVEETVRTVYACIPCCLGFASETCLRKHKINCVFARENESEIELVRCAFCGIWLDEEFLKHHMDYNCEKYIGRNQSADVNKNRRNHRNEKSFKCSSCDAAFVYKANLSRHMSVHNKEKYFYCNECDYKASYKYYLIPHIRNKHSKDEDKKYQCSICDYKTHRRDSFKKHMDFHEGIKVTFKCDICDRNFAGKNSLKKHILVHSGEKPFNCDICNRNFAGKDSLKRHILIHSGEKPFNCDMCEYRCRHKATLDKHRKRHTGERPHACHICGRKFLEKCKMVRHMIVHVKKTYICSICTFTTNLKSDLCKHISGVHSTKNSS